MLSSRQKHSHNLNVLFSQGALNLVGGFLAIIMWGRLESSVLDWMAILSILSGAMTTIFVMKRQDPLSDSTTSLIFGLNLIPVYGLLWLSNSVISQQHRIWVPFEPHELACLTIAFLAPPGIAIGVLGILLIPVLAEFQYMGFSPEQLTWLPAHPLFAPMAFGTFALVLYFFRRHGVRIADLAAKSEAETQAMKKVTHAIHSIKDLANSPIQALTLDAETLKAKHPEDAQIANRIERSVNQLRDLNQLLDEHLRGSTDSSVQDSFDPYINLKR
jgi:hypothetical protein